MIDVRDQFQLNGRWRDGRWFHWCRRLAGRRAHGFSMHVVSADETSDVLQR